MARGPKKSLEEKIQDKYEIIEALKIRIKSEQSELEELLKEKQSRETQELGTILKENGLSAEEAKRIISEYIENNSKQTA